MALRRLTQLSNHFIRNETSSNSFLNVNSTSSEKDDFPKHSTLKISSSDNGTVLWITLNRPQKLNAISTQLRLDLHNVFDWLFKHEEVRIAVLRGEGRAFCAGLDLDSALQSGPVQTPQSIYRDQKDFSHLMTKIRRLPQVVITLLQGPAVGGGFCLALASDIRIATKDCKMNAAMINLGLGSADLGLSYFLPRLVGWSVAAELLLTGAYIHAERAEKLGLVSRIVDTVDQLEPAAKETIEKCLRVAPLGLRLTKQALHFSLDSPSLDTVIGIEDRNQALCSLTKDCPEAVSAFLEKRKPNYQDK